MTNISQDVQSLLPTAEPTDMDIAFFAGFYEGEGSVTKKSQSCIIQIPQKDPEVLFKGRAFWGGSVRQCKSRDIWTWVMSGDRGRLFLQAIFPYMSLRRKGQIEASGAFQLTGRTLLTEGGLSPERKAARALMSEKERHADSTKRYYLKNREEMDARAKAWAKENRELLNARQREVRRQKREARNNVSTQAYPERSQLVN